MSSSKTLTNTKWSLETDTLRINNPLLCVQTEKAASIFTPALKGENSLIIYSRRSN